MLKLCVLNVSLEVIFTDKEEQILIKRFSELSNRSYMRNIFVYSDFLNMYEQDLLLKTVKKDVTLFGGFFDAERQIAVFGNEKDFRFSPIPPISLILVSPVNKKFSDDLTHRDFLGSVLGLGIKRETIGDIIIKENSGYIFCLESVTDFIIENLTKIKHTTVKCRILNEVPEIIIPTPTEDFLIISSERADVIIGAVFNLSRNDSNLLFTAKKVFINNKLTENNSGKLKENDIVSVRGYGRFKIKEKIGETRKGKLRIKIEKY